MRPGDVVDTGTERAQLRSSFLSPLSALLQLSVWPFVDGGCYVYSSFSEGWFVLYCFYILFLLIIIIIRHAVNVRVYSW